MKKLAILVFDGVELLDFCGPYEVFSLAGQLADHAPWEVVTVGAKHDLTSFNGLGFRADVLLEDAIRPDMLLIPGGRGVRLLLEDNVHLDWIKDRGAGAEILMSVCTGAWLLAAAGLVDNSMKLTTHHACMERLRELAPDCEIVENQRYIDNGKVVLSAGISAGIDMSLYMVGRLASPELAETVTRHMEYEVR